MMLKSYVQPVKKMLTQNLFHIIDGCNKGAHNLIKIFYFFSLTDTKLCRYNLDNDSCAGANTKSAEVIDHNARKFDLINGNLIKHYGGTTDTGGNGTKSGLTNEMKKLSRIYNAIMFFTATCCLYALPLILKSPARILSFG